MLNNNIEETKFIDLKTLGEVLHIKDKRTTTKWCEDKNIEIQTINKKRLVFRFLVDLELDKKFIKDLQEKHPEKWEELYRCYQNNDKLGYSILVEETRNIEHKITSHISEHKSRFSKILSKNLV